MRFCSIASGSSGNCTYIGDEETHILVDAGISGKRIELELNELGLTSRDITALFITHEHIDHIKSAGMLCRKYGIPIYATGGTVDAMLRSASLGKIDTGLIHEIREDQDYLLDTLLVHPFQIPHDAAQPVGYRIASEDKKRNVGIVTDLGRYSEYIIDQLTDLDLLLVEANHDVRMLEVGRYPYPLKQRILGSRGHLSNEDSGKLICHLLHDHLNRIFLGHLSKDNNYEELAYQTVCAEITLGDNPYKAEDFNISVAHRDRASEIITI